MTTPQKILDLNAFDMGQTDGLPAATARLVERRRNTFGPSSMLFYKRPLHVVRAEGVWLYEADGTRVLDAYNNVPSIGHCHPAVVEAVSRQIGILNIHTRYLYDGIYTYAERLLATFPGELSNIVFTCTGSESADFAMRAARGLTGREGFIVTANAYHGNTLAVTGISPSSASTEHRPANVAIVPAPDTFRCDAGELASHFADHVRSAITELEARGIKLAAFVADSIFSSDGVFPATNGFLTEAIDVVRASGALYIADEVQPGFSRTGESMWGFQRHGLVPDLVILGKPMGNGFPMGGVVIKPDLLADFGARAGYFNTFGGNPVAAAAGLAVLDTIRDEGLQQNAYETGAYLRNGLADVAATAGLPVDVRGAGLYIGVECVSDPMSKKPDRATAERLINAMRDHGVLIGSAGTYGNILKIRPPLAFRREHADVLLAAFAASLRL
jgi:4-aminobutyrate aminotransferase-like enzyme